MRRHIVLVGLPGSGKTVAGRLAATTLGCPCCDLDERIAAHARLPIPQIFAARGETAFRRIERDLMDEALSEPPQVIAPGGGWAAYQDNLERALGRALVVYLACPPEVAARRLAGHADRPLLAGDTREQMRTLSAARTPWYERAEATVEAGTAPPDRVAEAVVALARSRGGW